MDRQTIAELLGGWEGYNFGTIGRRVGDDGKPEVWIELLPRRDGPPRICGGCGKPCESVHDVDERWVKDLPILECSTHLLVHRVRVNCSGCGPKLEKLSWLEPYARVTARLASSVARLCKVTSVKHAAEFYGLDWKTAKAIDKAHLERELGPVDAASLAGVEVIAMDEFATHKGQRYATVVLDPRTKRVLWVGTGHGREDVRPFFELLGEAGRKRVKAVVIDMNGAYARRFWEQWYARAIRSRIDPLKRFARKLKGYLGGILSHCRWPLHTSLLEGVNNKIKVIKRMAYGFRDDDYFFLKIRAAFPGDRR